MAYASHSYSADYYNYIWRKLQTMKLQSLDLSSVQIFSSALCCPTPTVYVSSLMLETKFRTRAEPQIKSFISMFMHLDRREDRF
jgi:hypothetical protein